ncbi:MAG: hypothetical protein SGILL_004991 [Bacillariaceae sp.]
MVLGTRTARLFALLVLLLLICLHFLNDVAKVSSYKHLYAWPQTVTAVLAAVENSTSLSSSKQETQQKQSCWRRCPHRNNHIVVNFRNGAGLGDRQYLIKTLGGIAGYLCANLHVPKPGSFLNPKHNRGAKVSYAVEWSDFWTMTWAGPGDLEGRSAINDLFPLGNDTLELLRSTGAISTSTNLTTLNQLKSQLPKGKPWYGTLPIPLRPEHHLVAGNRRGVEQFFQLDAVVEKQVKDFDNGTEVSQLETFVWEIPFTPYALGCLKGELRNTFLRRNLTLPTSFPEGLPMGESGCQYIIKGESRQIEEVMSRVWEEVQDPSTTTGFLHLRRGDSQRQCDTTIPKLEQYFNCTFADTEQYGSIQVLLATDETDQGYIDQVKSTLEDMFPHVTLTHLDPLIEKHIADFATNGTEDVGQDPARFVNNFFTYEVTGAIRREKAAFSLSRRRTKICNDCDYLSTQAVKWVGL